MSPEVKGELNEILVKVLLLNEPITEMFGRYSEEATDEAVDALGECYEMVVKKYKFLE
jgi:hypothetical protein